MITKEEEKLIYDLILNKLDEEQFYQAYPIDLEKNKEYFWNELNNSITENDSEKTEMYFDIIEYLYDDELSEIKLTALYKKAILKNFSYHLIERLVDSLEKTPSAIKYFVHVLTQNYLENQSKENTETFMVPIWNKCLWALSKIDTDETRKIISEYKSSEYTDINDTVNKLKSKMIK
ncbi:hypothetical protein [Flavobacterium sp. N502540]|uniref:hypothetical protein n=1 Tax=Flavobacterium sp. N502540 TaxID=2986838 RepID=UPI002224C83A|nr:hypothetical protein [Flavobacterium sp. N502540]